MGLINAFRNGLVILLFLFATSPSAIAAPSPQESDTAASIQRLLEEKIDSDAPGYAVGVVKNNQVVFSGYAGLANLDTPTAIDARTRFNIASVAKQYTALMILELAHSGQIDLSTDFRQYLTSAMPKIEQEITVAHLITHTSGIRDVYDLFFLQGETWYEYDFTNRTARQLLDNQTDLNFDPGSKHFYSNSNYILLADLIAEVTGQSFPAYADAFFKDRDMESTSVRRRYGVVVPRLARAYGNWGSEWIENADIANTYGDGFVYTTLSDQLKWETQIWGHELTLPSELIAKSQRLVTSADHKSYGYGLEFGFYRGLRTIFHEGATGSYNSFTLRFPDLKTSIVTMGNTNQVNAVGLAMQVADLVLDGAFTDDGGYPDGPDNVSKFDGIDDYLGLYELDDGTFVRLVSKEGELYREIEGRNPVRMIQEKANIFHYETLPDLKLVLTTKSDGARQFALYSPTQATQFARPVAPMPKEDGYGTTVEGAFVNEETATEIILRFMENDEFKMIKNGRARTLRLVGRDYLVWNAYRIRVLRDNEGRAKGLAVDRNRIKNVAFDRID